LRVGFALALLCAAAPAAAKGNPTEITWLGHAAVKVLTPGGTTLYIDPWLKNPKAPEGTAAPVADVILVTHGHFDHLGDTVEIAKATRAEVISNFELTTELQARGMKGGTGMNVGGTVKIKDLTIMMVEAVHSSGMPNKTGDGIVYGGNPAGFVVRIEGGPTLYHAGDTGFFSSMEMIGDFYKPDYAFLPIGGHFTMGPDEAAYALTLLKPKNVIPIHWGTFPLLAGNPDALAAAMKARKVKSKLVVLEPGKALKL
jgi:L-ascorbate metabolism protein UlaG (beta-lactamase superfamily)